MATRMAIYTVWDPLLFGTESLSGNLGELPFIRGMRFMGHGYPHFSLCEYRRYLNDRLLIRAIDPIVNPSTFVSQTSTAYPDFELCRRTYAPLYTPPSEQGTKIPLFTLTIWMKYIWL